MNRFEIRDEVRRLLRDDNFPKVDIDKAINSVLMAINNLGRFRFHEGTDDLTLVAGTNKYTVDADILAEELVVYDPQGNDEAILSKFATLYDGVKEGKFHTDTTGEPVYYARYNDQWWIHPTPSSAEAGKIIRIYSYKDLTLLTSDSDTPGLPVRYHQSVLATGAAAQIAPFFATPDGRTLQDTYRVNLAQMIKQELWEPGRGYNFALDLRFEKLGEMGYIGRIRG